MELPKQVQIGLACLHKNGFEAYVVGGCVRDFLRGVPPCDFDICTSALPNEVKNSLKPYLVLETGMQHGTVTVVIDHMHLEVTTFRIDGTYEDYRRPKEVAFTTSLQEDLRRRDFTINAMAYSEETGVIDPFGGQRDIANKVLRCVGDGQERFLEDALRIMRGLRFSSVLGYQIEPQTAEGMKKHKGLLAFVAKERIMAELNKMMMGEHVSKVLREYKEILGVVMPQVIPMFAHPQNNPYHLYDVWEHTVVAVEHSPKELEIRLSVLFHDIGKPSCYTVDANGVGHFYGHGKASKELTRDVLNSLKYDNETKSVVLDLVEHHDCDLKADKKLIKRLLYRMSSTRFVQLLQVKRSDIYGQGVYLERLALLEEVEALYHDILKEQECFCKKDLAIDGRDVIACGIKEGRQIGEMIEFLMEQVLEDQRLNHKLILTNMIKEKMNHD